MCAYLDYYSTETRMYSWLVLAAILAITCFLLAYRGAGPGYWVAATVLMAVVLYLQYYGLYLLAEPWSSARWRRCEAIRRPA